MVTLFQFAGKGEGRELGRIGSRARFYKGQTGGGEDQDDNEQNVEDLKEKKMKWWRSQSKLEPHTGQTGRGDDNDINKEDEDVWDETLGDGRRRVQIGKYWEDQRGA